MPVDVLDQNNMPLDMQGMYNESGEIPLPGEIAADVAQMPAVASVEGEAIPQTGMRFDFGSVRVQSKEDFAALPQEVKELLRAMKHGKINFTEEGAAKFILQQRERQQRMADEAAKMANSPQAQAMRKQSGEKAAAARDSINVMRGVVNNILEHPGFSGSVGAKNFSFLFGAKEKPFAGTKEADFMAMLEQLEGGAFLQAFQSLKGGGPITDVEGQKATRAIARAQNSQSEEGFRKSMADVLEILNNAEKRLQENQTQSPSAQAGTSRPTMGSAPSFTVGQKLTDRFGNVRVYRGMDPSGRPILDPVQ